MIDDQGLVVMPLSTIGLNHDVSEDRISSGVPQLDEILGGKGYYRGSSILVLGTAGSGKTSLAASMVQAVCQLGERALFISMEESPNQLVRNIEVDRY